MYTTDVWEHIIDRNERFHQQRYSYCGCDAFSSDHNIVLFVQRTPLRSAVVWTHDSRQSEVVEVHFIRVHVR